MQYTIKRNEWVCGGSRYDLGESRMMNSRGRMCCLGQICNEAGVSKKTMKSKLSPMGITHKKVPNWLISHYNGGNSKISFRMMEVNDDAKLTQRERESKLKALATDEGHTLKFVGKLLC